MVLISSLTLSDFLLRVDARKVPYSSLVASASERDWKKFLCSKVFSRRWGSHDINAIIYSDDALQSFLKDFEDFVSNRLLEQVLKKGKKKNLNLGR